jgi:hypothetical protein
MTVDKVRLIGYVGALDSAQLEGLRRLLRTVWAL